MTMWIVDMTVTWHGYGAVTAVTILRSTKVLGSNPGSVDFTCSPCAWWDSSG